MDRDLSYSRHPGERTVPIIRRPDFHAPEIVALSTKLHAAAEMVGDIAREIESVELTRDRELDPIGAQLVAGVEVALRARKAIVERLRGIVEELAKDSYLLDLALSTHADTDAAAAAEFRRHVSEL